MSEERESWLENPRLSLESLTPGQRYTSLLAIAVVAGFLAFGMPSTTIATGGLVIPTGAVAAGLAPSAQPTPATTAIPGVSPSVSDVTFDSPAPVDSGTTVDTTPTTSPTTSEPPSTTTTTQPGPSPLGPITLPTVPVAIP